ncbi:unnamed protein product [Protopolystoma xenopodis]|uniref:Uncharacterized protein n=1 Tax=Protopolystoma xenopodis TaxID=117903 RepID=A0A3S5BTN6_9PLAT|nr:unnamed protein product [Protopolystoma xenopodis]
MTRGDQTGFRSNLEHQAVDEEKEENDLFLDTHGLEMTHALAKPAPTMMKSSVCGMVHLDRQNEAMTGWLYSPQQSTTGRRGSLSVRECFEIISKS